jgi:hypothetical protein
MAAIRCILRGPAAAAPRATLLSLCALPMSLRIGALLAVPWRGFSRSSTQTPIPQVQHKFSNTQITQCTSPAELLQLFARQGQRMHIINLATSVSRLAQQLPPTQVDALPNEMRLQLHALLDLAAKQVADKSIGINSSTVTKLCYSLAVLQQRCGLSRREDLWRGLLGRATPVDVMAEFDSQSLSLFVMEHGKSGIYACNVSAVCGAAPAPGSAGRTCSLCATRHTAALE